MQIPCVYLPGPAPAVTVANKKSDTVTSWGSDEHFFYIEDHKMGSSSSGNLTKPTVIVPDRRCRVVPEVVLVRRGVFRVLGIWRGEGGERVGQGRSVYKQPETEVDGSCQS